MDAVEMKPRKKKKSRNPKGRERHKRGLEKHQKETASSPPSERPTVMDPFIKWLLETMEEEREMMREWESRKIPAGGARGPRAAASSQNQLVL